MSANCSRLNNALIKTPPFGPGLWVSVEPHTEPMGLGVFLTVSSRSLLAYPVTLSYSFTASSYTGELVRQLSSITSFCKGEVCGWSLFLKQYHWEACHALQEDDGFILAVTVKCPPGPKVRSHLVTDTLYKVLQQAPTADITFDVFDRREMLHSNSLYLSRRRRLYADSSVIRQNCCHLYSGE